MQLKLPVILEMHKENSIVHNTHQPAYSVVIKYLYHSADSKDIKKNLEACRHKIRNIINAKHRKTKQQLIMFFVDFEQSKNNKGEYQIRGLEHKIIENEPPKRHNNIT